MDVILKRWRFLYPLILVLLGALASQGYAVSVPIGEQIDNGEFGTDAAPSLMDWTAVGGAGVNARASSNVINTNAGVTGFDSHFSTAFAVLGDNVGQIGGGPTAGTNMLFQDFMLPATQAGEMVTSYDLSIDFRTAFDGTDTGSGTDSFSVVLILPDGFVMNLITPELSATPMTQRNNDVTDLMVHVACTGPGTCDGTYRLQFQLMENDPNTNTAAGIDQVSITGVAIVPDVAPIPEPSTMLLLASGLMVALPLAKCSWVRRFFKY